MGSDTHKALIERYELGSEKLNHAIQGLKPQDLLQVPDPDAGVGLWSIQQVVLHLADAEAAQNDRIKRIIAEEDPVLLVWDENAFVAKLFYEEQSADDAAKMIELGRRNLARVLRKLPDEAWDRTGRHSVRGVQSLEDVVTMGVNHLEHHVKFIVNKRERFGKVMW